MCSNAQSQYGTGQLLVLVDVAGAGDTVISTFSLLVAAEYNIEDCVKLANIAAGKAVGKKHTSIVEIDEIFKD